MVEEIKAESAGAQYGPYIEELHQFLLSRGVPFGSPRCLSEFVRQIATPGPLEEEVSSLLRAFSYTEGERLGRVESMQLLTVAVGGPEAETAINTMPELLRPLFTFVSAALRPQGFRSAALEPAPVHEAERQSPAPIPAPIPAQSPVQWVPVAPEPPTPAQRVPVAPNPSEAPDPPTPAHVPQAADLRPPEPAAEAARPPEPGSEAAAPPATRDGLYLRAELLAQSLAPSQPPPVVPDTVAPHLPPEPVRLDLPQAAVPVEQPQAAPAEPTHSPAAAPQAPAPQASAPQAAAPQAAAPQAAAPQAAAPQAAAPQAAAPQAQALATGTPPVPAVSPQSTPYASALSSGAADSLPDGLDRPNPPGEASPVENAALSAGEDPFRALPEQIPVPQPRSLGQRWILPAMAAGLLILGAGAYLVKPPQPQSVDAHRLVPGADPAALAIPATPCVGPKAGETSRAALDERSHWAHRLLDQELYNVALPEIQEIARLDPGFPGVNLDESVALLHLKRLDEAQVAADAQVGISECLARLPSTSLESYCNAQYASPGTAGCRPQLAHLREAAQLQSALVHLELDRWHGVVPAAAGSSRPEGIRHRVSSRTSARRRPVSLPPASEADHLVPPLARNTPFPLP